MTKKLVGLMVMALLGALVANAGPVIVNCSLTSGTNTTTATSNGQDPTVSGTFTCTVPTMPVGNSLASLDLLITDDYSLGTSGSNNEVAFSYSTSNFSGASTLTTTVLGAGGSPPFGVSSTAGGIVGQTGTPTCTATSTNAFDCSSSPLPGTLPSIFTVTGTSSWVSGSLVQGGTDEFSVQFDYTYGPTAQVPEPATLMLIGGGLVGLALAARRRQKA